jgi:hypothetical protein
MLPFNALRIIKEYSRPLTKPDWRKSKPIITIYKLYLHSLPRNVRSYNLTLVILKNIQQTDWYDMYNFIKIRGINSYYKRDDKIYSSKILHIDGIQDAVDMYYKCKQGLYY